MLFNQKSAPVLLTDSVVMGGNMRRKKLVITQNTNNQVFVNFGRSALDGSGNGIGMPVAANMPPLYLTYDNMGDSIREEIHAVAGAGTPTITINEFFEP